MSPKSLLPFILLGCGFVWMAFFAWWRRRSTPGSEYLSLVGAVGLLLFMIAAGIAAYVKWSHLPAP
ncbi:MAG TPA: hypothetical protein VGO11_04100 [Chthoniobacteraceae bacterium]|jgi:hypothetical protein|nr:hypothetical protein [Chthoniobacteraceae bacterium]